MALKCGANKFKAGADGSGQNADFNKALIEATQKFNGVVAVSLQQANGFLAQQCPAERCPKKTTKGPSFSDPRFKISYRKAVNEWLVFFSVTVEAEVDCKVQKK